MDHWHHLSTALVKLSEVSHSKKIKTHKGEISNYTHCQFRNIFYVFVSLNLFSYASFYVFRVYLTKNTFENRSVSKGISVKTQPAKSITES